MFTGNSDTCVNHGRTAECFQFFLFYQGSREAKPHGSVAQRTKQMPRQGPEIPDRASGRWKFLSLETFSLYVDYIVLLHELIFVRCHIGV